MKLLAFAVPHSDTAGATRRKRTRNFVLGVGALSRETTRDSVERAKPFCKRAYIRAPDNPVVYIRRSRSAPAALFSRFESSNSSHRRSRTAVQPEGSHGTLWTQQVLRTGCAAPVGRVHCRCSRQEHGAPGPAHWRCRRWPLLAGSPKQDFGRQRATGLQHGLQQSLRRHRECHESSFQLPGRGQAKCHISDTEPPEDNAYNSLKGMQQEQLQEDAASTDQSV
ncbi:hypothetical protein V5799_005965 [Amblyomma americanum]|uniref:Uncharacterized protein n=1 Tax=Amblyomma americanum TaxID=6943 RepID=A0AAQ4DXS4_AMBAM